MNNRKSLIILLAAALILAASAFGIAYSAGAAGTASNPVVTKDYVDAVAAELEKKIAGGSSSSSSSSEDSHFVVVEVAKGKKLVGSEGTEIILRSGTASAIASDNGGVSDLTDGVDLKGGAKVYKNHHLLVPREDGRGINCTSNCYVMVKGDYTLK